MTTAVQGGTGGGACEAVREQLPEASLGTLRRELATVVERHLTWCAGCRKEAAALEEGAAVLGILAGTGPPPGLEDRVVAAVGRWSGAGRRRPIARGVALVAAAALAVAALAGSWAFAMRQRMLALEDTAGRAASRAERFEQPIRELLGPLGGRLRSGPLRAPGGGGGVAGRALVFDAPDGDDWVLVVVGGLSDGGVYRATVSGPGWRLSVGRLWPSVRGELAGYRIFSRSDLRGATKVTVLDQAGRAVLSASLASS